MNINLKKNEITILYVEDEPLIRQEIGNILGLVASNVILAQDGQDGLQKFKENTIDIIVTDVNMPIMNGFDMLKEIRSYDSNVPAIILSAHSSSDFLMEATKIDIVNDYLFKPVNITELISRINKKIEIINERREYKNTQKLLAQYKIAVDQSTILTKMNLQKQFTYVNNKFTKVSGFEADDLIGKPVDILYTQDTDPKIYEEQWEKITDKHIWKGVLKKKKINGDFFIVEQSIIPIVNQKNQIEEFIVISNDITELEMYKESLKKKLVSNRANYNEIVHMMQEYERAVDIATAVIRVNNRLEINFINDKFKQLTQFTSQDLFGKNFATVFIEPYNDEAQTIIQKILDIEIWQGVLKFTDKNGNFIYLEISFVPILDHNKNIIEYMGIGFDITETIELYEEIDNTQKDVIFTLGSIGESRSKETGNHVKRVAEYSYILAKKLGLSSQECELIRIASPMHDIGKVGIPDSLLLKPSRFTNEEFEMMKAHSTIGYNMLKNSKRPILQASATIAYEHHEKWDGTGYPRGLKGEEIHIYGRITALADVFDALGSDRCYKKAWELSRVIDLIKEQKSKHFDPKIVDIFLDNLDEFIAIKNTYSDTFSEE